MRTIGKSRSTASAPARQRVRPARRANASPRRVKAGASKGRVPDAPGIMVSLNAEHRHIAALLDALGQQSDELLPGRQADLSMMKAIVRYLHDFPDEFHHPREDLLFQVLGQRDPGSREAIARLQEGHREIYRRSRELLDVLSVECPAGCDAERRRLKYLCDSYIGFYRDHINAEEGVVFRQATRKLRSADWALVNDGSRQVDDPLFGERVRKEYRRLSLYLATRVERVGEEIAIAEVFGLEALVEGAVSALGAATEIRGIVARRLGAVLGECRDGLGQPAFLVRAPLLVAGSIRAHAGEGMQEVSAVLDRARGEFGEAVSVRMRHLRRLIG